MKEEITRTDFIRKCGLLCVGGLSMAAVLESCASASHYAASTIENNTLVLHSSEFSYVQKDETKTRQFVLIKSDKLEFPICVYKFSETEYRALYTQCTHQGCEVQPHPDYLVCPCHGSEFSNTGKVVQSPAETDLRQFPVTVDGDRILIQL